MINLEILEDKMFEVGGIILMIEAFIGVHVMLFLAIKDSFKKNDDTKLEL